MTTKALTHKKKLLSLAITSCLIGMLFFFSLSKPTRSEQMGATTPTLFVHGYKGGPASFHSMLDRFEYNQWGSKQMIIKVSRHGVLNFNGYFNPKEHPFIQVIFANNRASIAKQTKWLNKIMTVLKKDYGINQVNLVGHSMGGVSLTSMIQNRNRGIPDVQKLVVIGSPFKGIYKDHYFKANYGEAAIDLQPHSKALEQLRHSERTFPEDIEVLAIAGVINQGADKSEYWDGLVHLSSVRGVQEIVPLNQYREEIIFDHQATHSGMHESKAVDQYIVEFLWRNSKKIE